MRVYRFREFMSGIGFVNEVARLSEELNHHPMIHVEYKKVTLRLTSWRDGGLTELDFRTAAAFERAWRERG
ncbi:4a-hydroxytetrahydrobiopterin dehydratase [Paenibacillus athensensis]|uniref:4a-hydroxytetrahydrobiopterin dehydratase n=1 Tax=Paenibacillus athensensis TaxID=1967502 RepID=UPI002E78A4E4|nr:4a-hydroxytetrahydrobiopterin dehydratase [Paenibacillus athensensis]